MVNCTTPMAGPSPSELIRDGFVLIARGIASWFARIHHALEVARAKRDLRELDDRQLRDIGLRRDDIDSLFRDR